jgi:hypothetical protein
MAWFGSSVVCCGCCTHTDLVVGCVRAIKLVERDGSMLATDKNAMCALQQPFV